MNYLPQRFPTLKACIIFFCLSVFQTQAQSDLVINEMMLSNENTLPDEDGDYPDWVELYNSGSTTINLNGYGISDRSGNPYKWVFPSVNIAPGDYLIIFASEKDRLTGPYLHTNFKLTSDGEDLVLTDPSGITLDHILPISIAEDISYGRVEDGSGDFERLLTSTPNLSNNLSNGIVFSHNSGFYANSINLEMTAKNGNDIYYTTDGSVPTDADNLYTGAIPLSSLMGVPDVISNIPTSPYWSTPDPDNFKAHIIRAACFNGSNRTSNIYDKTYFVEPDTNARYPNFKVISVITDPENLFDHDSGIYVQGAHFSSSNTTWTGNYFKKGRLWEKPGNIQCFNEDGNLVLDQNVGLRTHGGKGRNQPQKSLRVYARHEYGAPKVNYPFFDYNDIHVFSRMVIRNSLTCWNKTVIKDDVTSYVCRNLRFDKLATEPVVVFLNGEYWGVQSIREYFDDKFIEDKYDVEEDSVNIVIHGSGNNPSQPLTWGIVEGDNAGHIHLYDFLNNNSLTVQANYDYIKTLLSIGNIIDYYCTEIYFNNKDWPTNNNKLWNKGTGKKWRQVLYDMDGGWQYLGVTFNALSRALSSTGSAQNSPYATFLFRKLMEAPEFREGFASRMACLIKTDFSSTNVNTAIDLFESKYTDGMVEHIERWGNPSSFSGWQSSLNSLRSFATNRATYMIQHMTAQLGYPFNLGDYDCIEHIDTDAKGQHTDIQDLTEDHFMLYPNPSTDKMVWLDFSGDMNSVKYDVYSLLGTHLQSGEAKHHDQIYLNYDAGTYLIRIQYGNKSVTKKVIIW